MFAPKHILHYRGANLLNEMPIRIELQEKFHSNVWQLRAAMWPADIERADFELFRRNSTIKHAGALERTTDQCFVCAIAKFVNCPHDATKSISVSQQPKRPRSHLDLRINYNEQLQVRYIYFVVSQCLYCVLNTAIARLNNHRC